MKNFLKTKTVNNGMIRLLHDFCSIHNLTSPFNTETLKENSINFEQWLIALGSVYKQYGKETFGLKLASYIQPSYTGILGYLNSSYETLFQVVNSLSKYIATWYDYMPLSVEFTEREVILSWENAAYLKTGHYILEAKIAEEFLVATMINRLNQLSSPNQIIVSKVEFTFDNCEYHKSHFNCEVIYNSSSTKIYLNNLILDYKIQSHDSYLNILLTNQIDFIVSNTPKQDMFIEELNQNIIKSISENKPSIQYVSQAMGISVRVLQNKLKLLDTSFVDELSMIRKNLAYKYLQNTNLSISEIAVLLAYKEQPSFNRSFKQWTGVTPLEWRAKVKSDFKTTS